MKSIKPELYYDEKGNPKGYRAGIHDDVYGTCPFCGKSYTEEDVKNGKVNFEHIFPRFAVKKATDEPKVFSRIESEFMVGVHKDCNDRCSLELERQISRVIANVNKPHVHLMQEDIVALFNYCIKTSIFLRYLFMWEDSKEPFCYDTEKLSVKEKSKFIYGLNFYKNFAIRIRNVDSSAGLYWGLKHQQNSAKYCLSTVLNNIEISFFPSNIEHKYAFTQNSILITTLGNTFSWFYGDVWEPHLHDPIIDKRGIPWKLEKSRSLSRIYNNNIETLADLDDNFYGLSQNYFIRQRKLSLMSQKRFEANEVFPPMDRGIVFYRNKKFYLVDKDGLIQDISELPAGTKIPNICFRKHKFSSLPNASKLEIIGDFIVSETKINTLKGTPQFIQGHFQVPDNKLTTLQNGPVYVGKSFACDFNEITSLVGVPKKINENFSCSHNKIKTLIGAPEEVGGDFLCVHNLLTSLEGAPKKVGGSFYCRGNKLTSLKGAPKEIGETFSFDANNLVSLDGLPKAQNYFVVDCDAFFHTSEELCAWFKKYKNERMVTQLQNAAKKILTLTVAARKNKNIPDDQHEM